MTLRDYIRFININKFINHSYKNERERHRNKTPPDIILKAVRAMKLRNLSIRQAASEFNMNYRILSRYYKKISEEDYLHENIVIPTIQAGYVKNKLIFTKSQEQQLVDYILYASDIYFGLSPKEIRILAYNLAVTQFKWLLFYLYQFNNYYHSLK